MEAKKKEHLKLEKNSSLYFVIGLTLILGLIYTALEWKSFETNTIPLAQLSQPDYLPDEQAPYIKPPELPKPKPVATPEITIVDDEDDIIEDDIKSTESNPEILIPKETNFEDLPEIDDEIPFMVIEYVPVFPGCESAEDKRACFQEKMQKHIRKNFRYPEEAQEMGLQGKVYLQFTVQKDGSIGGLKMRGPHQILESEASRIISKLPKMEPGKQRGQAVKVPFSIPITFKLQ